MSNHKLTPDFLAETPSHSLASKFQEKNTHTNDNKVFNMSISISTKPRPEQALIQNATK